ncbi:MAG TPA: response regulator [Gemmatimonadales bacterium]|jgi:CheY-like chemotaxis protein|nr:response regulator [Gemmatimonadales bacterium]
MTYRVLIVDDELAVRRALERALRHFGYDAVSAGSGDSAYELLAHDRFDAILLDIRMPLMAGDALFVAIVRRWPELRDRIILMSGDPDGASRDWSEELKHRPLLDKPFNFETLHQMILAVLPGESGRSEPKLGNGQG